MRTTSVAALAILLVTAAFFSQAQAQNDRRPYLLGPSALGTCCTSHNQQVLPLKILASYEQSSDRCILPAIIFKTKRGDLYCADPQAPWTRQRMSALDKNAGN
ncbi:hypothetical protein lerEdw1_004738 [Lerista edwardsae]|nr:hypothetical protein lerEdw1_004738 [Lerista edwardsae]